jgi:hypothetical protein
MMAGGGANTYDGEAAQLVETDVAVFGAAGPLLSAGGSVQRGRDSAGEIA